MTILRSSGLIVIIGGVSGNSLVAMSDIQVYDTNVGKWIAQTANGATPPSRKNHVAAAAILDTASWSWKQPAFEGTAPTGRYSHSATMVGSNLIISFGLTAGGATNTLSILDTVAKTWVSSYVPRNLTWTSTKPEDWPGYKPPPVSPQAPTNTHEPSPQHPAGTKLNVGPILGGLFGSFALLALIALTIHRYRKHRSMSHKSRNQMFLRHGSHNDQRYEAAYKSTGMAFEQDPTSLRQRLAQVWWGALTFWRKDRKTRRSTSQRLDGDDDDEDIGHGLRGDAAPSDQELFLAAVHRARSRTGIMPPNFVPLQQPMLSILPSLPTSPRSPQMPQFPTPAGFGGSGGGMNGHSNEVTAPDIEEGDHERAYSDGFENAMMEMDIQMLAVPRGRLFVVNPSEDTQGEHENASGQPAP
ncbi:hypothetical protein BG004_006511 [Podila humilis]|nr:hypothetical protein BG004_006511 [Podila humilis]